MALPPDAAARIAAAKPPTLRELPFAARMARALEVCQGDTAVALVRAGTHRLISRRVGARTNGRHGHFACNQCGEVCARYSRDEPLDDKALAEIRAHGQNCPGWKRWQRLAAFFVGAPAAVAVFSDWLADDGKERPGDGFEVALEEFLELAKSA